jgi:hypothetical protein
MTLRWVPGWNGLTEPEAVSYVAAVEAADGQELEFGVARAINDFVLGCKNDRIWDAIKASCILAGARTTNGALVPLVGDAPDPYNFDLVGDTDYDRKTGLKGDGSTKYLDSNRNNNADPQNSQHASLYVTTAGSQSTSQTYMGSRPFAVNANHLTIGIDGVGSVYYRSRSSGFAVQAPSSAIGLIGISRSSSANYATRQEQASSVVSALSGTPYNESIRVFSNPSVNYSNARLAFYSIGESLDLEKLDNRVTRLMNLITYTQTAGLPDLATMDIDAAAYIGGGYRVGGTLS